MRQIIFSNEFEKAVEAIGGYRVVDMAIEAVVDGLRLNPYGFPKVENDWVSFRYAVTVPFDNVPALAIFFRITGAKDVELTHVEVLETY